MIIFYILEEPEVKLTTSVGSLKKQETSRMEDNKFVFPYENVWFHIGKGVCQGCILSLCLFNLYAVYIMRNAWLDEAQAGIKIAGRNINNLIYADETTLMAESKEELRSHLMKVKEESGKVGLKLNIQKTKIIAANPSLHGGNSNKLYFWELQNHCRW